MSMTMVTTAFVITCCFVLLAGSSFAFAPRTSSSQRISPSAIIISRSLSPPSSLKLLDGTAAVPSTTTVSDNNTTILENTSALPAFLHYFQGDFDNYPQVVQEWQDHGLRPREHGGHEHMHCTLVPVTNTTRMACFYLDGHSQHIFRLRYYSVHADEDNKAAHERFGNNQTFAYQQIYTLHPQLETAIRTSAPDTWLSVLTEFVMNNTSVKEAKQEPFLLSRLVETGAIVYLNDCDVVWSITPHPLLHTYCQTQQQAASEEGHQFHALLRYADEIVVPSQYNPSVLIRIKDQLSLFPDTLYIHDRGRDASTNAWLYGNRRGVPYILQRIDPQTTAWTTTRLYETNPTAYQENMKAMGGATSMAMGPPKKDVSSKGDEQKK